VSLLEIEDLTLDIRGVRVLRGVTLAVDAEQAVGLVGESGSGKSLTLRTVARLLPDGAIAAGKVRYEGRDVLALDRAGLREHRRDLGMVFQDPRSAINPVHTVGAFLTERARDARDDVDAARRRAVEVLARMGIDDAERRLGQYPHELSGGLLQRVMIGSVLMEHPPLLLADEPTTALDVTTQADVLALTDELRRESRTAMLLVTHDLDLARAVCDGIVVMYAGRVLETMPAGVHPVHPYTRGLLASRPPLDRRLPVLPVIPGVPVTAEASGAGCPFAGRCPVALPSCSRELPAPRRVAGSLVSCHRADEVAAGALDGAVAVGAER
jgi:oligopeptide/dipeptide ABC transporter ATP-binding protein